MESQNNFKYSMAYFSLEIGKYDILENTMSASDSFETAILNLIFANLPLTALGLPASPSNGQVYLSLHTSDPGDAGNQSTGETIYAGYARVPINRGVGAWTVTGSSAKNAVVVDFPGCTSGTATITHFGIGTAPSGSGNLLFSGALLSPLAVETNIIPSFGIGALTVSVD